LNAAARRDLRVVLGDLAFANGGESGTAGAARTLSLPTLLSYAGWNTANNSLGGALAHVVLAQARRPDDDAAAAALLNQQVCVLRLLEDGLYQGQWRKALRGCADKSAVDAVALTARACSLVLPWANTFCADQGWTWRVVDLHFPWGRSFEIDLRLAAAP